MNFKFLINCSKAANYCDKAQYGELNAWERIVMRFHQQICKLCKQHSTRNTHLSQLIEKADIKTLTSEEKENIKNKLVREIGE
ncbi:MAG: hypothetical protein HKM28_07315 [Flavobacteriaceae bacterium]|nr:hypothetical protein [Flavobacteriaceae bacterium]